MKLSKEEVKRIIAKVFDDLNLTHSDKYPIMCSFHKKGSIKDNHGFDHWSGRYDYRDPEAVGDEWLGMYPEYILTINDETGKAYAYHYYTGHFRIDLNDEGNYEVVEQMYRKKKE